GSLGHCLGMCGPLILLAGSRFPKHGKESFPYHLLYHSGRIMVYGLLGLGMGGLGSLLANSSLIARAPAFISLVLGLAVLSSGFLSLGIVRLPISPRITGWWRTAVNKVMRLPGFLGILLLGGLNGLLPCGLVYSALLIAASNTSAITGGLGMLLFGLGTLPVLIIFGVGVGMLTLSFRQNMLRISGIFVMMVGIQLAMRGSAALGMVPHWMVGKVMIW
ncbi:MAG TPA: sulfite exporter TauE/SafE family protein, partial [Leptolinea sp.]